MKRVTWTTLLACATLSTAVIAQLPPSFGARPSIPRPTKRRLTSADRLSVLLSNPAAKAAVQKVFPELLASSVVASARNFSPRQLATYSPQMFSVAKLEMLDADLARIPPIAIVATSETDIPNGASASFEIAFRPEFVKLWDRPPGAKGVGPDDVPTLTVVRPDVARPGGASVVIAPGGGYYALSAIGEGREEADKFAARGVTAFVLRCRLAGPGYRYPTQLLDAQRAIRSVRSAAAHYGLDPAKIGMMGFSAGGHLTAMAETPSDDGTPDAADPIDRFSSRPDFAMLIYPGISLDRPGWTAQVIAGPTPGPATRKALSPAENVTARTPPTFIVHATGDELIPSTDSTRFYDALRAAKVPAELHDFDGGRHGFGMGALDGGLSAWPQLLETWLTARGLVVRRPAMTPIR